jgi:hypothetical protein
MSLTTKTNNEIVTSAGIEFVMLYGAFISLDVIVADATIKDAATQLINYGLPALIATFSLVDEYHYRRGQINGYNQAKRENRDHTALN